MDQAEDRKAQDAETAAGGSLQLGISDVLPDIVLADEQARLARVMQEMAGRKLVLIFLPDPRTPAAVALLREFARLYDRLSPHCRIFGITATSPEINRSALDETLPFSLLSDAEGHVFRGLGVGRTTELGRGPDGPDGFTVLIADENCRILRIDRNVDKASHAASVWSFFQNLPTREPRQIGHFAPVLYVPKVFEPEFCRALILLYDREGGSPSPSYVEEEGEARFLFGESKIRRDHNISDADTIAEISRRVGRRVLPGILKAFTRRVTGIEKFKIGCYEAEEGGRFEAHRDNTGKATAHRRFAMSINLNTGDYEGGFLHFPEFGPDLYRPDTGDAVVYSSSLLHEVTTITSGRRFTLLAHMYDEESRQLNPKYRDPPLGQGPHSA